jgi:hypothetical protein
LLDIGNPGVPFFYPLSNKLFTLNFLLLTSSANGISNGIGLMTKTSFTLNPLIQGTAMMDAPVITTFGLLLFVIVAILLLIKLIVKKK